MLWLAHTMAGEECFGRSVPLLCESSSSSDRHPRYNMIEASTLRLWPIMAGCI